MEEIDFYKYYLFDFSIMQLNMLLNTIEISDKLTTIADETSMYGVF